MWYLISLIILFFIYAIGIIFIKQINRNKIIDILIPILIFTLYLVCVLYLYNTAGISDWNFLNALPTANVSPFMFCSVIIIILLPENIKKYGYTLISFLSLGMFCAGAITLIFNAIRDYNFYWNFVLDSVIHVLLSLYGIYLAKTVQIFRTKNKQVISCFVIVFVALTMLILNLIFKTSFFGLSLNGGHNIYNVVLCNSSILSAIIYFVGLSIVLFSGYIFQKIIIKEV